MQTGSRDGKEKARETKAKDKMVENEVAWDKIGDENGKKMYKKKKSKAKKAVVMAKGRSYDDLYARLQKKSEKE